MQRAAVVLKSVGKRNKFTCCLRSGRRAMIRSSNAWITVSRPIKSTKRSVRAGLSRDVVFTSHIRRSALTGTNVPDVPARKPARRFPVRRRVYASRGSSCCACQYQYFKPSPVSPRLIIYERVERSAHRSARRSASGVDFDSGVCSFARTLVARPCPPPYARDQAEWTVLPASSYR